MIVVDRYSFAQRKGHVLGVAILCSLLMVAAMISLAHADNMPSPLLDNLPKASDTHVRLVMVAIEGCPFCMRWESQVGKVYPKSPEAKVAPLVRVRFGSETLAGFKKIKYTPTFLILRGENEIGRIAGYPGADPFWEELGVIFNQHDVHPDLQKEVHP